MKIGVDIGGTFTDVVGLAEEGQVYFAKVASTPDDLIRGVKRGVAKLLMLSGCRAADVERFVHGTTVATNAILERKGASLGILATAGFEDVLEIGRQYRSRMYDLFLDPQTPIFLAPRKVRIGIPERLASNGEVVIALDESEVRRAVRFLTETYGVEAIAVCYLFSYLNAAHELRTREIIRETAPQVAVSLSSEVDPVFREYERVCLTAFDAYVRPVVSRYVARLEESLREMEMGVGLEVMQSRGGISSSEAVIERPVTAVLSGPAAGVIGGKFAGALSGYKDVITVDIGGTSCDVSLVTEAKPLLSTRGDIAGYPIRIPLVDVVTIGAGGGSIAWMDSTGGMRVGPRSAGAVPGPACYGIGGMEPTVTDAAVVLGHVATDSFAGGEVVLHAELARQAVARIGERLGRSVEGAAEGIMRIINSRMIDAIRLVSIRRGFDPRRFSLVALGGAGPVHACALARGLGIQSVVVPDTPGVLSALGLLVADVEHEYGKTFRASAAELDFGELGRIFDELLAKGLDRMRRDHLSPDDVTVIRMVDVRYVGQSYELPIVLPTEVGPQSIDVVVKRFHEAHEQVYGHADRDAPVEFVNLRCVCSVAVAPPPVPPDALPGVIEDARRDTRDVLFPGATASMPAAVYERRRIPTMVQFQGPAIIEQPDSTVVVPPGWHVRKEECRNLVMEWAGP